MGELQAAVQDLGRCSSRGSMERVRAQRRVTLERPAHGLENASATSACYKQVFGRVWQETGLESMIKKLAFRLTGGRGGTTFGGLEGSHFSRRPSFLEKTANQNAPWSTGEHPEEGLRSACKSSGAKIFLRPLDGPMAVH